MAINLARIIYMTKELVALRTVNYDPNDYPGMPPNDMQSPGEEYKVIAYVKNFFEEHGIRYTIFDEKTERPSIIGYIGKNSRDKRSLLIAVHADTMPADPSTWKENDDPFTAVIKGDMIIARGVLDNKGPMASTLEAALALKDMENSLEGEVMIGVFADEEVGGSASLERLVKEGKVKPTDALIPDHGGQFNKIMVGEKGRVVYDIKIKGKEAHGSTPLMGLNAIAAMHRLMTVYLQLKFLKEPINPLFVDDGVDFGATTLNEGKIEGGTAPNMVPAYCSSVIDVRYLPGQTQSGITRQLNQAANFLRDEGFIVEVKSRKSGSGTPFVLENYETTPLVSAIRQVHSGATPLAVGGGTVAKALVAQGICPVGWGPGDKNYFHVADERISVTELFNFAEYLTIIAQKVVNTDYKR